MNEFYLKKILELPITDIASVYGGVRGRTMSSQNQFLWHQIKAAGVKTVIDLREGGSDTKIVAKCVKNDLVYFYYPVDNYAGSIRKMVELFPELCRLIDEGNFYISCAMGLHRTDIALCCYWMFYGADKEIEPPIIMRYIDDFEKCICYAVNHDGDSDSTGAVAGKIIGEFLAATLCLRSI